MSDLNAILNAYAHGIFPMADGRDNPETYWVEPKMRGVIPLAAFNIPRSLKKFMVGCDYKITINQAFDQVIAACAQSSRGDGQGTWINAEIETWFNALHHIGHAHSIEVWDNNNLIGGLYGLTQGGCFNGESMFSRAENASKIALVHLVERLKSQNFTLLDTQFTNDHLKQFGCIEIPQEEYLEQLNHALKLHVKFD